MCDKPVGMVLPFHRWLQWLSDNKLWTASDEHGERVVRTRADDTVVAYAHVQGPYSWSMADSTLVVRPTPEGKYLMQQ